MTITTTYKCASLIDIAEHFENIAAECSERAKNGRHTTKVEQACEVGRADAFLDAARILRNTTFAVPPLTELPKETLR